MENRFAVGEAVTVRGFKTPGVGLKRPYDEDEVGYINAFKGKTGTIEEIDNQEHQLMVFFGEKATTRRCRFSEDELAHY